MILSPSIWTIDDVNDLTARVKSIIQEELLVMEYTTAGNSFRKQFAMPLNDILIACDDYLSVYGDPSQVKPDAARTKTFFIS